MRNKVYNYFYGPEIISCIQQEKYILEIVSFNIKTQNIRLRNYFSTFIIL